MRVEVWPTSEGSLHLPLLAEEVSARRVEAVLKGVPPGSATIVADPEVRAGLLAAGAREVRHVHTMRHGLGDVPTPPQLPGTRLRAWRAGDAELLAPALVAAYGPEHVDPHDADLGKAARSLAGMVDDPDNPLMPESTWVAEAGAAPVGAAIVLRSDHLPGWTGPWLMNVFRHPMRAPRGTGATLVTAALAALRDAGETHLGLAVTSANPARRTYERLGFDYDFEGWILVLPAG